MKKFFLFFVTIALVGITLFACQGKENAQKESRISYCQTTYYMGQNQDFVVRLVGGKSETTFVADGKVQDVQDFCTITIVPQHVDLFNEAYAFVLTGETGSVEGELAKDSFGASYSSPIADLQAIGTPKSVQIKGETVDENIDLTNLLAEAISGEKALAAAQETIKEKLQADDKEREIYIKYINDSAQIDSPYYWYVAFIAAPTDYYSVLVDSEGKVVSVNP